MTASIPEDLRDLLDRPLFAALGTVRHDNTVQVNPMWFDFTGKHVKFTHTTYRAKFRNLRRNPALSVLIVDPDDPMRYIELRGELVKVRLSRMRRATSTCTSGPLRQSRSAAAARFGRPRDPAHERREGRPPLRGLRHLLVAGRLIGTGVDTRSHRP